MYLLEPGCIRGTAVQPCRHRQNKTTIPNSSNGQAGNFFEFSTHSLPMKVPLVSRGASLVFSKDVDDGLDHIGILSESSLKVSI